MRGFAVIVDDRGQSRCIAVFSQKFRGRSFVNHLKQIEPLSKPRLIDVEIDGGILLDWKEETNGKELC